MASSLDICNLALAHLGADANVNSIDPPEGSVEAELCARFYYMARDALLESFPWNFATRRAILAELSAWAYNQWEHAYALPADCLQVLAVLSADANADYQSSISGAVYPEWTGGGLATSSKSPQDFSIETDADDRLMLLTNQADAVIRYIALVEDTTRYSPNFVMALSWHLAGLLAGPILKGAEGSAQAQKCAEMAQFYVSKAVGSDVAQRQITQTVTADWMSRR